MATLIKPTTVLDWAGRDVTQSLGAYVKHISFSDSLQVDETSVPDTLSITLRNPDGRFLDAWYPSKGDILKAGVRYQDSTWMWGVFEIDDIKFRFAPDELIIGANAAKLARGDLDKAQSRAFDNIALSALLNIVANEAGMNSVLTGEDVTLIRVDQQAESSMSMIKRLASLYGLPVNIKSGTLYMGIPKGIAPLTLSVTDRNRIQKLDLPEVVRGQYTAVKIDYYDQDKRQLIQYIAGDDQASNAQILRLYDAPVTSHDEAVTYANAALKEQNNQSKSTGSITLTATPITSGQEMNFTHVGKLHPSWMVLNQTTTVSDGGWTCNATIGKRE